MHDVRSRAQVVKNHMRRQADAEGSYRQRQCRESTRAARTLHAEFGVGLTDPTLVRSVVNIDAFGRLDLILSWDRARKFVPPKGWMCVWGEVNGGC